MVNQAKKRLSESQRPDFEQNGGNALFLEAESFSSAWRHVREVAECLLMRRAEDRLTTYLAN